ncbi:MAG: RepB DNA-primase from phage plasmid, partial [Chloroflexota bacterium]
MMPSIAAPALHSDMAYRPDRSDDTAAIARYFAYLYEGQRGYFRLNAGIADDNTSTGIRMLMPHEGAPTGDIDTRQWFFYDAERPDILETAAAYAVELRDRWGNVYTTRTTFRAKQATKENANPSRLIFVDDAPEDAPLPWSLYLRTGRGPGQGFLKCDKPTTQADARGVAVALLGDRSGSNENKVLRIPRTFNTKAKHGGRFPVHAAGPLGRVHQLERLRQVYPPVEGTRERRTPEGDYIPQTWDAEKEKRLTLVYRQVKRMLSPGGMPRVVLKSDPDNQGRRIFEDRAYIATWKHASGSWDASTVRHIRVKALVGRGLTDEQAAAAIYACEEPDTIKAKGSISVWRDIMGRVDFWRIELGTQPSVYSLQLQSEMLDATIEPPPLPTVERASRRRGRPECVAGGPHGYLAWLERQADPATGAVMKSARECAAGFGHSLRTIRTYEKRLRAEGLILREVFDRRQQACVYVLRRGAINQAASADRAPQNVVIADTTTPRQNAENAKALVIEETHLLSSPVAGGSDALEPSPAEIAAALGAADGLPAAPPRLRELVAEALDVYGGPYAPTTADIEAALQDGALLRRLRVEAQRRLDRAAARRTARLRVVRADAEPARPADVPSDADLVAAHLQRRLS